MRAYAEAYWSDVVENQGKLFDFVAQTFSDKNTEDFINTYNMLEKIRYDGVFAFMYSKRDGTVASKMENQIDSAIKRERVNRLLSLTKQITKDKNKESIGQIYNVLVENYDNTTNSYITKTDSGKTIIVESPTNALETDRFYSVKIIKYYKNKLYGEII